MATLFSNSMKKDFNCWCIKHEQIIQMYISGHKGAAVLLPGFAISW